MSEADWEKLKDDYQSLKAPEQLQPRILLAMEPQRSGLLLSESGKLRHS